jgi:diguanylate cyclase (GGDEF)-like protein/PAS domain S-box-containing protein
MKSKLKFGIRSRLLASLFVLLLFAIGLTGIILLHDAENHIDEFRQTQLKFQARTLADGSLDGLVAEDFSILEGWVASSLPSKEYAYASLVRLDGRVMSHTTMEMIGKTISTPDNLKNTLIRNVEYLNRPVKEAIYPAMVGTKHLANAHVAYYLDLEYEQGTETILRLVMVLVLSTILFAIGIYLITKRLINPIRRLTTSVSEFSIDKNIIIEKDIINRKDEIGELSSTFQNLFHRLTASYKELDARRHELEYRVKERTQELQKNESYIKSIIENVADAVVSIGSDGIIQSFNTPAEKLFGYNKEDAIGKVVNILMPETYSDNHHSYIKNYLVNGKATKIGKGSVELIGKHKDGYEFPMEISVNELVTKDTHIFIAIMRDITERKKELDDLHYYANHDTLTGIYNRKHFMHELEYVVDGTRHSDDEKCALLYIDLDKFKYVNDTMGHATGDQVLRDVTAIMKQRLRKSDLIARLGGDEFAIILFGTTLDVAEKISNSFRDEINRYKYTVDDHTVDISCSIGIAMINENYQSADDVLADADKALYEAKHGGRNQVCIFKANK